MVCLAENFFEDYKIIYFYYMKKSAGFFQLIKTMKKLLGKNGCPWDKKQTHKSLLKYLRQETGEVGRAVRNKDWDNLKEELGDLLLQVVFHAELASMSGRFDIYDVLKNINSKLIRRHPHVFGKLRLSTPGQVLKEWNRIKEREKRR
jgi:tetrapyrrole methylase family protein/MazG family protein